ncbi:MAG TPA: helix-turn-helix domain-containing protein [Halococcus sp.]|nr:helix-turn-helix domain-containing protein [Halococcus sp.]
MTDDTPERKRSQAVSLFCELGLTEYEARVYVALLRLGTGTAREIAEIAGVPRTRIYDATDRLTERGFVDVQRASPKMFRPASRETALRKLQLDHETTLGQLSEALSNLEPATERHEQTGVWSVTGRETVTERVLEFIAEADEEVVYMGREELLTGEVVEALAAADERGADIRIGSVSPVTRDRIKTEIPSAEPFETLWDFAATPAGRLVMIDRETILVSAFTDGGTPKETAIWGGGERNSLVVVLKAIFTWQLDHPEIDADE